MAPQVLVLGMPRTGTQSICEALRILGHKNNYHMTSVGPNKHHDKWVAALEAKFEGKGSQPSKKEFDELVGDFDAVSDFPCSIFYRELMTAYPDAQIILTTRSEDAWFESMSKTLHIAYVKAQSEPSKLAKTYNEHLWANDFPTHGREAFRKHNEGVQKAAAEQGREVLIFDATQGWESLCAFLEKPVPAVSYPRKDMWVPYKNMVKEVEAGRLTEKAITLTKDHGKELPAFMASYIYTQSPAKDGDKITITKGLGKALPPCLAAYIYTQSPLKDGESITITKNRGKELPPCLAAYIYTQSPAKDAEAVTLTKDQGKALPPCLAAYIYTQSPAKDGEAVTLTKDEGKALPPCLAAYIYTQSPAKDGEAVTLTKDQGKVLPPCLAAYIYTQSPARDGEAVTLTKDQGNALPPYLAAYIYTQSPQKDGEIAITKDQGKELPASLAAYIYTQSNVKAAYIYTQ
ncbi:hypothetical protein HYALB_00009795 [Hymenoscyphus albidus]|uniref:Uncharacterized protein n=1 Tax=Hymenoscyphus albidus TaxID=595503 RepID=A0A9N9LII1_9HELO|nr:hypothetical protein HYALB_00009795 [Hymenoscyphus albidus]